MRVWQNPFYVKGWKEFWLDATFPFWRLLVVAIPSPLIFLETCAYYGVKAK